MIDYIIGLDLGTGSTKALAVNLQGNAIASTQVHYQTLTPSPGYCEQAPELVWQAFVKCVSRIIRQQASPPIAIVLSSAMHSIMPVDAQGTPLRNMIIWSDNRSAEMAKRIRNSSAAEMLYEQTGTPIHAMSPLCKLLWMKEHDAGIYASASRFISIKEYIWHKLFGTFEADHSIASASGLMDIEKLAWNDNALDLAGLQASRLSALVSTSHQRRDPGEENCTLLGIDPQTVFIIGASDGCLANLGSFATVPGTAALTIGTSGAVRVVSKSPVQNFEAMTFNYRLDEETFVCGGPSNNGGAALKWFVENFLGKPLATSDDFDSVLKTLPDTNPGADGLIFLPYLFGERAPLWDSDATGAFYNIRSHHTQAHFTRAVIEGISMALYDIADNMMRTGSVIDRIHVSGGFVRSTLWLQVLADIFNKKICLVYSDDASALGAAYLGLKTLNRISGYDSLKPGSVKEILPRVEYIKRYQENFTTFRQLYQDRKQKGPSQNV